MQINQLCISRMGLHLNEWKMLIENRVSEIKEKIEEKQIQKGNYWSISIYSIQTMLRRRRKIGKYLLLPLLCFSVIYFFFLYSVVASTIGGDWTLATCFIFTFSSFNHIKVILPLKLLLVSDSGALFISSANDCFRIRWNNLGIEIREKRKISIKINRSF